MNNKVEEKCELIMSDINNIIEDLNCEEMKLAIKLVAHELITILNLIEKY